MRMKTILNWLYENWMKGTPFLALYTFILIWLYVKDANYPLFLIWLQCSAYWLHEFEEYVCPGGFLDYFKSFRLDPFTVDWNDEIGFAPRYLYERGMAA